LLEVLVHPLRLGKTDLVQHYRDILLHSAGLITVDLIPDIAQKAAGLRARHNIRTPDAIQIATTLFMGATAFLTNDHSFSQVPEIATLVLDEL
jgi:predicted nucleic acid-binding protein